MPKPIQLGTAESFAGDNDPSRLARQAEMRRAAAQEALERQEKDKASGATIGSIIGGLLAGAATLGSPAAIAAGAGAGGLIGGAAAGSDTGEADVAQGTMQAASVAAQAGQQALRNSQSRKQAGDSDLGLDEDDEVGGLMGILRTTPTRSPSKVKTEKSGKE